MTWKQRWERLYSGLVYDAMTFDVGHKQPFVVHRDVRSSWPIGNRVVCGPAFTCRGERVRDAAHIDDMVRIEMFRAFTPGCVQVIDTGGDDAVAHFGDISGKLARKHGAVGAVIDGYTRDLRILEEDGFPVFCRGAQPVDAFGRWQIVEYQEPVWLPGIDGRVRVNSGDWVFADSDGAQVIPQAIAEQVCVLAEKRLEQEDEVRRRLAAADNVVSLYHEVGRW
jgi:regulator of RNase E activity RraA